MTFLLPQCYDFVGEDVRVNIEFANMFELLHHLLRFGHNCLKRRGVESEVLRV